MKFRTIIRSQGFNFEVKLSFNKRKEGLNNSSSIIFEFQQIYASTSTTIINNGQKVFKTINGRNRKWSPDITMNKIKNGRTNVILIRKKKPFVWLKDKQYKQEALYHRKLHQELLS